jgi:hypothetical protein
LTTLDGGFEEYRHGAWHIFRIILHARTLFMTRIGFRSARAAVFFRELLKLMRAGVYRGRKIMAVI